jgi:hypothetical protein
LRLGVLYGRRRQGKSEILQQLCDATGGLYTLALEQHSKPLALHRFADALAGWASLPTGINLARLIACGSALSVMSDLLAQKRALYGRVMLNICLGAFDHVDTAEFWGIEDPETALRLHSVVGGVPGYKELTAASAVPRSSAIRAR